MLIGTLERGEHGDEEEKRMKSCTQLVQLKPLFTEWELAVSLCVCVGGGVMYFPNPSIRPPFVLVSVTDGFTVGWHTLQISLKSESDGGGPLMSNRTEVNT